MLRNSCSRSCTRNRVVRTRPSGVLRQRRGETEALAAAELARLDGEEGRPRRPAGGDPRRHRADAVGQLGASSRRGITIGSQGRWAATLALRTSWSSPSGLVTRSSRLEPDKRLLLAEKELAGLAHRGHPELVVEDQERGRLAGQRVARAGEDHAHAAARADALAQLRPARRILRGMAAARAETDRLGPTIPSRSPRPVNPNQSRHARRLQHGRRLRRLRRAGNALVRDRTLCETRADTLAAPLKRRRMAVQQELWGSETTKAIENFPVSGERVPAPVVRWLGRIKAEAARVNAELGLLDADIAERVARAGDEVAAGQHDDQFPIDVFQTGSGTSIEHERQRGDREPRRRGRSSERPREHGAVVERRVPVGRAPRGRGHGPDRSPPRPASPLLLPLPQGG